MNIFVEIGDLMINFYRYGLIMTIVLELILKFKILYFPDVFVEHKLGEVYT